MRNHGLDILERREGDFFTGSQLTFKNSKAGFWESKDSLQMDYQMRGIYCLGNRKKV